MNTWKFLGCLAAVLLAASAAGAQESVMIGTDRELFLDNYVIDRMENVSRQIGTAVDCGKVLDLNEFPWEGCFCNYVTVLFDEGKYRLYYRGYGGSPEGGPENPCWGCYAESQNGIDWIKPHLGIVPFPLSGREENQNNIILTEEKNNPNVPGAGKRYVSDNLAPFIDTRPGVPPSERYKAAGGNYALWFLCSEDGIHWRHYAEDRPLTAENHLFDSQNVTFWSVAEKKYLLYMRSGDSFGRTVARAESDDYIHWSAPRQMEYKTPEGEPARRFQYYISQTAPYFRAPHISIATPARFMQDRRAISQEEAKELQIADGSDVEYWTRDCADVGLLSTRGGYTYIQPFDEALIRPGFGAHNWISRTNYPATGIVPTGPNEMSIYLLCDYAQKTVHLRRCALRTDGLASIHADAKGGRLITKPLVMEGSRLELNYSTSAAGHVSVEIQDAEGNPIPGFSMADCGEIIGNEIDGVVHWGENNDISPLRGKTVRLVFQLADADIYSFRPAP